MDYEIPKSGRQCKETEREIGPGEEFFSALMVEGAEVCRYDYSAEAWDGPPDGAIGWWKSKVPDADENKMHWAPNDVMLHLLEQLEDQLDKLDMRYVLALLLIRRRVLREEGISEDEQGREFLDLYCPRSETVFRVQVLSPSDERVDEIQNELAELLFSKTI